AAARRADERGDRPRAGLDADVAQGGRLAAGVPEREPRAADVGGLARGGDHGRGGGGRGSQDAHACPTFAPPRRSRATTAGTTITRNSTVAAAAASMRPVR